MRSPQPREANGKILLLLFFKEEGLFLF